MHITVKRKMHLVSFYLARRHQEKSLIGMRYGLRTCFAPLSVRGEPSMGQREVAMNFGDDKINMHHHIKETLLIHSVIFFLRTTVNQVQLFALGRKKVLSSNIASSATR